jgi:sortase A
VAARARAGTLSLVRRTIAGFGRLLVTAGLLMLLFVAYQLWGTGILEARAQSDLRDEFEQLQRDFVAPSTPRTTASATSTTVPRELPPLVEGDPVGIIEIPRIGLTKVFVEGTDAGELKKGPGHYPGTPLPGQYGNAAIAGHRTTYGAPFFDLDQLQPGDEIHVTTLLGRYTYRVRERPFAVPPTAVEVVWPPPELANRCTGKPGQCELTLTTCNPKYSARERLVVKADLVVQRSAPVSKAPPTTGAPRNLPGEETRGLAAGLEGEQRSLGPAYGWGAVAALAGLAWWWTFRRWRHPLTWLAGVGPFLVLLFVFYVYLERVLPAGY